MGCSSLKPLSPVVCVEHAALGPAVLPLLAAFFSTYLTTRLWIQVAESKGIVGRDMNKYDERYVAEAGGVSVVFGVVLGLFTYILLHGLLGGSADIPYIHAFALSSALLFAGFVGFVDDILDWKRGIPQSLKPVLTLPIALPFVSLALLFPGMGRGLSRFLPLDPDVAHYVYALLLVPAGVVGASNAVNMLAGFNGLEAGMSAVILSFFALHSLTRGSLHISLFSLIGVAALLAFLRFNWYPARVFPGDTLTYAMGAYIAALAILGDMEVLGIILFIPYFLELALKIRSRLELGAWAENFGVPRPDGTLRPRYPKLYSVTHILQRIPNMTEKKLVCCLLILEVLLGAAGLALLAL